jgi:hypothetical protein
MQRKLSLLVLGGLSLVPSLSGCGDSISFPQADTPTQTPSATPTRTDTAAPTQTPSAAATNTASQLPTSTYTAMLAPSPTPTPTATADTCSHVLVQPLLEEPAMWETVDSLLPTLTWSYPDPSCTPQGYRISLSTGPFFVDDLSGGTGDASAAWSPGAPLQPGKEYAWSVEAINGTTLGPIAGERYFFTGLTCAAGTLKAPRLLEPEDGTIITDTVDPTLIWAYPDACLPGGYGVRLSTSTDFEGSVLNGGTGNPSTRWGPGVPLTDCTRYYWQIVACDGGQCGPFSVVHTFRIEISPDCPNDGVP